MSWRSDTHSLIRRLVVSRIARISRVRKPLLPLDPFVEGSFELFVLVIDRLGFILQSSISGFKAGDANFRFRDSW
jgi:hypothetical protein